MDYKKTAREVYDLAGGSSNIQTATHCVTRLRLNVKDEAQVDKEKLKQVPGVIGVVNQGGQLQVIIGNDVGKVYAEFSKLGNFAQGKTVKQKKKVVTRVLDFISGSFTPILPVIIAAGMMKALLSVLILLQWISDESGTYYILNAIADAGFYFIPVLLGYTASSKLNTNPFMGMLMAFVLVHPNIVALTTAETSTTFLGITMRPISYVSSVIPIILIVWFMAYVEKFAEKVSPNVIKLFLKPLLIILITAPIGLLIIGPLGTYIGDILASFIQLINNKIGWLAVGLIGALYPWMVMTGMHYSVGPVMAPAYMKLGYDALLMPGALAANMAQAGAALAVSFKSKDKNMRTMARTTGITALMGVTEPAMYGVNLKLKKPMIAVTIAGGIGGLYAGLFVVKAFILGLSPGIAGLPMYVGDHTFIHALIALCISVAVAFVLTWIIGFDEEVLPPSQDQDVSKPGETSDSNIVSSPLAGHLVPLSSVSDEAFAMELMGKGGAIIPSEGKVYAPFDGKVMVVSESKHAIGLVSESGIEVLIHIGINTVRLKGKYFTSHIEQGASIRKGDLLMEMDLNKIKGEGYDIITPVIITNTSDYLEVLSKEDGEIQRGEFMISVLKSNIQEGPKDE
ncbi:beta-glucoside-specific PTS transporter subunit IIABC [Shouchella clausii]|uniref:beta-glucoside-specific PTS transporter subunit IIABC n=1 Tax=Shouchella clausii TaxID=79880 RepID=UPI003983A09E